MNESQKILTDAQEAHGYDPWYDALLHAALEETQDATEAVRVADEAFARQPADVSVPQDDDADAVFSGGDDATS